MLINYDWGMHESSLGENGKAISYGNCTKNIIECLEKKCQDEVITLLPYILSFSL